jgi:hypothetical protein
MPVPRIVVYFVPRPLLLERLCHAVGACADEKTCTLPAASTARPQVEPRVAVLHGQAGVGKTLLALRCVVQLIASDSQATKYYWLPTEQRDALQVFYWQMAKDLQVAIAWGCGFLGLVSSVNRALSKRDNWLLVLDNAPSYDAVEELIPLTPHPSQRVIITTRHADWPAGFRTVAVDVMDEAEAVQLVKDAAGLGDADQDADIGTLARELGRLPLALQQAADYIRQQGITAKTYTERLQADSLLDLRARAHRRPVPAGGGQHVESRHCSRGRERVGLQPTTPQPPADDSLRLPRPRRRPSLAASPLADAPPR